MSNTDLAFNRYCSILCTHQFLKLCIIIVCILLYPPPVHLHAQVRIESLENENLSLEMVSDTDQRVRECVIIIDIGKNGGIKEEWTGEIIRVHTTGQIIIQDFKVYRVNPNSCAASFETELPILPEKIRARFQNISEVRLADFKPGMDIYVAIDKGSPFKLSSGRFYLEPERHTIEFMREGFKAESRQYTFSENKVYLVDVSLSKEVKGYRETPHVEIIEIIGKTIKLNKGIVHGIVPGLQGEIYTDRINEFVRIKVKNVDRHTSDSELITHTFTEINSFMPVKLFDSNENEIKFFEANIVSKPGTAKISVEGIYVGESPVKRYMSRRTYNISAVPLSSEPSYEVTEKNLEIIRPDTYPITLAKKKVTVTIITGLEGCEVMLDGRAHTEITNSNGECEFRNVIYGKHDLDISCGENYSHFNRTITVTDNKILTITPDSIIATLKIDRVPEGGGRLKIPELNVDNNLNTLLTGIKLKEGKYKIEFELDNYEDFFRNIDLRGGKTNTIEIQNSWLEKKKGTIKLYCSNVEDVDVYLDGNYKIAHNEYKPATYIKNEGSYDVRLEKSGYATKTFTIEIRSGEEIERPEILNRKTTTLRICTNGDDVIYLGDEYIGRISSCIHKEVEIGRTYKIRAERAGDNQDCYKSNEKNVVIEDYESEHKEYIESLPTKLVITGNANSLEIKGPTRINENSTTRSWIVKPGKYTITGKRDGYKDFTDTINIEIGQHREISINCTEPKKKKKRKDKKPIPLIPVG